MSVNCVRLFFLAFAAALLSACASSGGRLQKAGTAADVYGMVIQSDLNWSRIKLPRQELWTIDGPGKITGLTPEKIPADPHAGWNVERFQIQRI